MTCVRTVLITMATIVMVGYGATTRTESTTPMVPIDAFSPTSLMSACPPDSVRSGTVCVDAYEASVWFVPGTQKRLIAVIQKGSVTPAELVKGGAVQLGFTVGDALPYGCPETGNGCVDVYAVSIPGVYPAVAMTWFQFAAAARNSHKRLPTNQEWQAAALGTPDGAPCNVSSGSLALTGQAAGCLSDVGAFDMVGNVVEWTGDWVPHDLGCTNWGLFSDDAQCFAVSGNAVSGPPGALSRGGGFGGFFSGTQAGVFAIGNFNFVSGALDNLGFRAVR
jgi:formylglycine-generating enzyme required for sulfatase activity